MYRKNLLLQPLGKTLYEADLISIPQLEVALRDQKDFPNLRLGEILALRGWLKQGTADFFVERFPDLLSSSHTLPIGQCLHQADLLNEEQIFSIILEQRLKKARFGEIAVQRGWLSPKTVDFFAESLTYDSEDLASQLMQELMQVIESRQMNCQQRSLFQAALNQRTALTPAEMEKIRKVHLYLSRGHIKFVD